MTLNPIRRAYLRGQTHARTQAVTYLREQAAAHQGRTGDARRRGALNFAADAIRDQRVPGRPS